MAKSRPVCVHRTAVDPEISYFLIIVLGLPLLLLLLTGPGMWSEKWGWRTLDKLEGLWRRLTRRGRPR
jgi:hypothetical protein